MIRTLLPALVAAAMIAAGCETVPETPEKQQALQSEAQAALQSMTAKDPSLQQVVNDAYGYAVFPDVGKAGAIAGAAYGRGIVYAQGQPVGYAELNQASVGLQLGGQTFAELIIFQNEAALNRMQAGNFDVGASASAVAVNTGVGAETRFENGIAVFVMPKGGLMGDLSLTGQRINFEPAQVQQDQQNP